MSFHFDPDEFSSSSNGDESSSNDEDDRSQRLLPLHHHWDEEEGKQKQPVHSQDSQSDAARRSDSNRMMAAQKQAEQENSDFSIKEESESDVESYLDTVAARAGRTGGKEQPPQQPRRRRRQVQSAASADTTTATKGTKIKVGESILEWQKRWKSRPQSEDCLRELLPERITIRHDQQLLLLGARMKNASTLSVKPPLATIVTKDDEEYTGQYTTMDPNDPHAYVECIAVYNEDQDLWSLELVDGSVTQLKRKNVITNSSLRPILPSPTTAAQQPREQLRHAEQEVRKRRAAAAAAASSESKRKSSSSSRVGYVGVTAVKQKKGTRYRAQIMLEGKIHYLGTYATAEEAARKYDEAALKRGKRARLNFPADDTTQETLGGS